MVAGHFCLDITPKFPAGKKLDIDNVFSSGKLTTVEEAVLSAGGPVPNVGLAMAKLGVDVVLNGKVGKDAFGEILKQLVGTKRAAGFKTVENQNTSYTIVFALPGIDRFVLHNPGTNDTFSADDIDYELVEQCSLFHFGYPPLMRKMFEDNGAGLVEIYKRVKDLGVTTSLDMAKPDPSSESGKANWSIILEKVSPYVDIFVPSIEEITYMLDRKLFEKRMEQAGNDEPVSAYQPSDCTSTSEKLLSLGMKFMAIKCGIRGLYLRTADKDKIKSIGTASVKDVQAWADREMWAPSYKTENFSSALGSGDATIAGFLCGLMRGFSPEDSLKIANTVGWQNVQTFDTLSGIRDWSTTLEMLKDKERPRNPAGLDSQEWCYSKDEGLYYGPNDKQLTS
ncbi:MAG: carbohydrate kinase family protein [Planctomycetota bacterium]|jgi:sugar/nucleoside kinase (ribokinase family)